MTGNQDSKEKLDGMNERKSIFAKAAVCCTKAGLFDEYLREEIKTFLVWGVKGRGVKLNKL